jgi:hypothetical protein
MISKIQPSITNERKPYVEKYEWKENAEQVLEDEE